MLLGASGSGKTVLFHEVRRGFEELSLSCFPQESSTPAPPTCFQLLYGKRVETVPSMEETDVEHMLFGGSPDDKIRVIDFPGDERFRGDLHRYWEAAQAVIFLVDASASGAELAQAAG
jgi:signal recognition particle receptor subunit beta